MTSDGMSQPMRVMMSKETVEWYTPPYIVELAREVLGDIDLDPASNDYAQTWIRAKTYYTKDHPGGPWHGRVWLNPPFDATAAWTRRLEAEYGSGRVSEAVLLVNSNVGYGWYEDLLHRYPAVLLSDRLRFIDQNGHPARDKAKKGQTVFYFGRDVELFLKVWSCMGHVIMPKKETGMDAQLIMERQQAIQSAVQGIEDLRTSLERLNGLLNGTGNPDGLTVWLDGQTAAMCKSASDMLAYTETRLRARFSDAL